MSIHTGLIAGGYVQIDETMVEYLSAGNGQTKQGYLCACKRPGADLTLRHSSVKLGKYFEFPGVSSTHRVKNILPDRSASLKLRSFQVLSTW